MSSSEPVKPILGKGLSHETKTAREQLEGERRVKAVEKVGEISDEQKARQKFRQFMGDVEEVAENIPNPFEAVFSESSAGKGEEDNEQPINLPISETNAPPPTPDLGNVEDAIVASPSYVLSSNLSMMQPQEEEEDPPMTLPQSDDFWENVDLPPDQALPQSQMQEAPQRQPVYGEQQPSKGPAAPKKQGQKSEEKKGQKEEVSLFGPPGKPAPKTGATTVQNKSPAKPAKATEKKAPLPSPFEEAAKIAPKAKAPVKKGAVEEGETLTAGPMGRFMAPEEEKAAKGQTAKEKAKAEEEAKVGSKALEATPLRGEEREGGREGRKGRDEKGVEIISSSLPLLPGSVEPFATVAAQAATPYLSPSTMPLFFQMVGTMYVMAAPPGVNRTEIVLNNPAFSSSRFFGATITIEKYATAPDSFNIRLTGNDDAVTAFKDNLASLLAAFQNSKLPFRIGRLEAEYSLQRPVFHRKGRGEERGGTGGSGLGKGGGGKR